MTQHIPVLLAEVLHWLDPQPGQVLVDGTLGGGGHARALAQRVGPRGRIIALDRDPAAVERARETLAGLPVVALQANYADFPEVLDELGIDLIDGILLDLGLSSDQLGDPQRGFSFDSDGPLDMRFDPLRGEPAWRLVNRLSAKSLADVIYQYGEERYSRRIAKAIEEQRRKQQIRTCAELAAIVRRCVPRGKHERIDPATRTFQALRIAVNDELKSLEVVLARIPDRLRPGGRAAIISFHSLEDRRVKEAFRGDARYKALTRKPIVAGAEEQAANPRSRGAKLRVARRT